SNHGVMPSPTSLRPPSGYVNAIARENQLLPGDWRQLGAADHKRISAAMARYAGPGATLKSLEACLMVNALITTGRRFEYLGELTFLRVERGALLRQLGPALILRERHWSWWLPAGGPTLKNKPDTEGMVPISPNVWLPVSTKCAALLKRCFLLRAVYASSERQRVFTNLTDTL